MFVAHYAFNTFDQNALLAEHTGTGSFIFVIGLFRHGSQQSPAKGRGVAGSIMYGAFRALDLTPFNHERIVKNEPFVEKAAI